MTIEPFAFASRRSFASFNAAATKAWTSARSRSAAFFRAM